MGRARRGSSSARWRCCIRCAVVADAQAADLAQRLGAEKLLFIGDAIGAVDIKGRLIAGISERQIKARRCDKRAAGSLDSPQCPS